MVVVEERSYSYIVFDDEGVIKGVNSHTGEVDYSGEEAATVINAVLSAIDTAGGGSLLVKKGQYDLNNTLTLYANTILVGKGINTILKLKDNINKHVIAATSEDNITIRNLKLDGNKANQTTLKHGIYLDTVDGATISHITLINAKYDGMRLKTCIKAIIGFCEVYNNDIDGLVLEGACSCCRIMGCLVYNNGYQNIHLYGGSAVRGMYNLIAHCTTYGSGSGYSNLLIEYQDYAAVSNCIAHSSGGGGACGVDFTRTRHSAATNCICYNNTSGISVEQNGTVEITISNCICRNNTLHGIHVHADATHVVINGCICIDNGYNGILLDTGDKHVISGCTCRNSTTYDGISINGRNDCVITGNICNGNNRYGIFAYNGADYNVYVGNNLRGNGTAAYDISGNNNQIDHNA